ncbi:galactan beta-1,4-galactosyltransferase GALS3-like [Zingiber officinale]|uniref:galactan beta-1,4-galactosyltransferase GALS3-like n=1 Tax=Zingiber officinale TaxID=94328 RepID=UPI001C4C7B00|nr:galactan beta-1,4-galactosyltransferase GALS3-like [Zingiber officinale]
MHEWMAHHAQLFGQWSYFMLHDVNRRVQVGVGIQSNTPDHEGEVLQPCMEMGVVMLQDVREQEHFDGYYHNQFLIMNDCLHRYRFTVEWIFFFDVNEFIYLSAKTNLASLLTSIEIEGYLQFTMDQMPMLNRLCRASDYEKTDVWGVEKLVYRDAKRVPRRDRKYAVWPLAAFAAGVHMSQNIAGRSLHKTEGRIKYFHYHGTIADRRHPCREFANPSGVAYNGTH